VVLCAQVNLDQANLGMMDKLLQAVGVKKKKDPIKLAMEGINGGQGNDDG
jgi:hypothetical protein